MNKLKDALNKDVREYNVKLLIISGIIFIALMGFISYKLTNSSYALFTDSIQSAKTITLHYEAPKVVTFNPDGGTIPTGRFWTGSGNSATKEVTTGLSYGDLPVPTKEGYTFKGWNGKNLFNIDTSASDCYVKKSNGENFPYVGTPSWACSDYIEIVGGHTYTFNPNSTAGDSDTGHATYDTTKVFISSFNSGPATMQTSSTAKYIKVSYKADDSSNIQLEEGSTATAYEPYYITETTKVVQSANHTLKAIWEANHS